MIKNNRCLNVFVDEVFNCLVLAKMHQIYGIGGWIKFVIVD